MRLAYRGSLPRSKSLRAAVGPRAIERRRAAQMCRAPALEANAPRIGATTARKNSPKLPNALVMREHSVMKLYDFLGSLPTLARKLESFFLPLRWRSLQARGFRSEASARSSDSSATKSRATSRSSMVA
jgi:hypothetical protein